MDKDSQSVNLITESVRTDLIPAKDSRMDSTSDSLGALDFFASKVLNIAYCTNM